ncbi:MAG: hypothetical protein H7263_01600, partial [Candidatus Sericytochromatia bacterium]|nr:hypothetical protein [Candidatus Sericytochromatia bacterium]
SAISFYEIGIRLKIIKSDELFRQKGFSTFQDFLRTPEIDITTTLAERFMLMNDDEDLKKSMYLGSAKVTEILKLDPEQRKKILFDPIEINGEKKTVDELSLNQLKKVSQEFKRSGKMKCDRCGRWVDHLKELDGKFYGAGNKDSCYDKELEERRSLEENAIPAAQFDNVLNGLKSTMIVNPAPENEKPASTINWLPESIYQIYGQFLHQYEKNSEELSYSQLEKEEEIINKLVILLKTRLRDVKESISLLAVGVE